MSNDKRLHIESSKLPENELDGKDQCRDCGKVLGAGYLCDDCDTLEVLE